MKLMPLSRTTAPRSSAPRMTPILAEIAAHRAAGADLPDTIRAAWAVMVAEYLLHVPGGKLTADDRAGLTRRLATIMGIAPHDVAGVVG